MKLYKVTSKFPEELNFNIQCILFGHAWYNNKCTRCGATR